MDLASLVGFIGSFAIIIVAMVLGGDVLVFVNIPSLLVVVGGSVFVVLAKYTMGQFFGSFGAAAKAFSFKSIEPIALIEEVIGLADEARKGGLLSLEGKEVSHPFLQAGIRLLVDGHEPEVVSDTMTKEMKKAAERHASAAAVYTTYGDVAPAMGMIGTLIGLVQMLSAMDDPKSIGPAMAVALLTTLYGAMIANMVTLPIADKLKIRALEESLVQSMIIDSVTAIQAGQNPRVIRGLLNAYIAEKKRPQDEG